MSEREWDEPPATVEELRRRLVELGQEDHADELIRDLVRPAVHLVEGDLGREDERGTRFGGRPWMAVDAEWPRWEGEALSMVAQVNLADVTPLVEGEGAPVDGVLCFFYPGEELAFGEVGEEDAWPVVYTPAGVEGRVHDFPDDLSTDIWNRHPAMAIEPTADLSFTDGDSDDVRALGREVTEAWETATPSRLDHRFLGYAESLQHDLPGDVAYQLDEDASDEEQAAEARRWRLLLQLDSNSELGFNWGDAGFLYWMIRDEDLRAGRFDSVFMILQCC